MKEEEQDAEFPHVKEEKQDAEFSNGKEEDKAAEQGLHRMKSAR